MTPRKSLLVEHIVICLLLLGFLLAAFFLALPYAQDVFTNPQLYFNTTLSSADIEFATTSLSFVIASVLIAYALYLLLTSKTRVELMVWKQVRDLANSREQFKRLYESAPVPYVMLNEKGEIRDPNKAALRFFGVVPEEIVGKNLFSFGATEESEHAKKLLQLYILNIPINKEELQMVTKGGPTKWASLSVFDMRNPIDKARVGLATIFDITEEKKLNQAKTEFVSLASHQLRSPLATLKWYVDMLMSKSIGDLLPKQQEYLRRIYEVNEEMIELAETLLNVSRMEIGSFEVVPKTSNVQELCESVLGELSSQIDKKGIKIERQYHDFLKNTTTDPKLLRIVIQNLVSNAVKYTPDGGTVTIALSESPGTRQIIVSDTGVGIPKAQQERVFSKLFRADNVAGMNARQSTGLGLYLVKSIIETMKGEIVFVSEENKGSTFTITL